MSGQVPDLDGDFGSLRMIERKPLLTKFPLQNRIVNLNIVRKLNRAGTRGAIRRHGHWARSKEVNKSTGRTTR